MGRRALHAPALRGGPDSGYDLLVVVPDNARSEDRASSPMVKPMDMTRVPRKDSVTHEAGHRVVLQQAPGPGVVSLHLGRVGDGCFRLARTCSTLRATALVSAFPMASRQVARTFLHHRACRKPVRRRPAGRCRVYLAGRHHLDHGCRASQDWSSYLFCGRDSFLCAVANRKGLYALFSPGGSEWHFVSVPNENDDHFRPVTHADGKYLGVDECGTVLISSDGISWDDRNAVHP